MKGENYLTMNQEDWVTLHQAEQITQRTYWQLHRYITKNKIEARLIGRTRVVRIADLWPLCTEEQAMQQKECW